MTLHTNIRPILFVLALLGAGPLRAQDAPLSPAEAPRRMTLPEGFVATLFAGEPDLVQPIAFAFDDRGRLWVVECLSYPDWQTDGRAEGHDRVVIFDDRDGDGRFDEKTVFWDKGVNLSGIELGYGGVWLCSTPNLVFVPDADRDDVPDGAPQVKLDGWDLKARHNVFNGLTWAPDGWLYGCNGILSNSSVGPPGTPNDKRVAINCGVWRYHPVSQVFEAVAHGTTNPWGLDFDEFGQAFITNCVIHHLFHVVPGGHYQRMFGQDMNPHSYSLMTSCADHIHWGGGPWQSSRGGQGEHDRPGGGHAHSGAMVYLGDNWPQEQYRGGLFTCNIHGNRVNHDRFERLGSGCVAHHAHDAVYFNDTWFRGLTIKYGPDGGVFVSDWCDSGECHDYDDIHRTSGRIYKITYKKPQTEPVDLASLTDAQLVERQLHPNDWHVTHARRLLAERAAAGKLAPETPAALVEMARKQPDATRKLRAIWALHGIGRLTDEYLTECFADKNEDVRAWAVRLSLQPSVGGTASRDAGERWPAKLATLAAEDPSPRVRLELASGLQRLPLASRWAIAENLLAHGEDAADANLPLLIWYGVEPLVPADAERALQLAAGSKIPLVREYIVRRFASDVPADLARQSPATVAPLVGVLKKLDVAGRADAQLDLLRGAYEAFAGRRSVAMPNGWKPVYARLLESPNESVREQATFLSFLFGDRQAADALRADALDSSLATEKRNRATTVLVQGHDGDLLPALEKLVSEPAMRAAALRGLAAYDDPSVPAVILRSYVSLVGGERDDALATLASRPAYALALLDAIEAKKVSRGDVPAFVLRQVAGIKDERVSQRLQQVWGAVREASQDKAAAIARFRSLLPTDQLQAADRSHGRALFVRTCAACHKLFGEGGQIGPELTGAQRTNLDYLLENLVDPSALVGRDYQMSVIETADGRIINGIIAGEDAAVVTVQTQNDRLLIPKSDIETREQSKLSLMPEGLLDKLSEVELRELIAYLSGAEQAALPDSSTAGR
ncbi:MAG TPA: PVC-type heme-binding CxxCH protein [Pirellulales bacterium]|nr:PVC-type heme-binding CxxCH protein [Pirellulales bacterium]